MAVTFVQPPSVELAEPPEPLSLDALGFALKPFQYFLYLGIRQVGQDGRGSHCDQGTNLAHSVEPSNRGPGRHHSAICLWPTDLPADWPTNSRDGSYRLRHTKLEQPSQTPLGESYLHDRI
jgi:hypothetical protein